MTSPDIGPTTPAESVVSVDPLQDFHPAVRDWFRATFAAPTPAQAAAWPLLHAGRTTLVSAPTGSGKTLTAFLAALDDLVVRGCACLATGKTLPDETSVLYVSPLKALSNDIQKNLSAPLAGIGAALARQGLPVPDIRTAVRTGDTPQSARTAMARRPPHILVTTPESLYVLLGSESGRRMMETVRTVIIDEIHAVAPSKRGAHLALSLARLDALCARYRGAPVHPVRVGLSATQKPITRMAAFLAGAPLREGVDQAVLSKVDIVDTGHFRARDLALELPPTPLDAVMSNESWETVYDRIAMLAADHKTTLVFVNTRRMAERAARHLADRLGTGAVAAHHGSMSRAHRLDAEQRLKSGALRVLIATASLELGIDIGDVDLVCQLGSPRSIGAFLQRVGRAGHQVGGTPKGRLFPTSRDDLIECAALLDCVARSELDTLQIPSAPLDVLAQQIVAEVAQQQWDETALFEMVRRATPFAALARERFDAVLQMLAEGFTTRQGPRAAYLHRDSVEGTVRARRNARLTAVTAGGTIPDNADYTVVLEPQALPIGTVHEDFAVESLAGDVFQLGNTSYRIMKIEAGKVRVADAQGQPPNIPFWLGEAPGRSDALSEGVARLRASVAQAIAAYRSAADIARDAAIDLPVSNPGLVDAVVSVVGRIPGVGDIAARQIADYLARSYAALSALPTRDTLVMERFFDASGGMQLVLHAPYGSRVNRAWGLALRKRFCRHFNVELQAAATEDAIVLSLSTSHSFPLDEVWRYLHSASAERVLIQALLDAPLFGVRWRWNATTALALPRQVGGRKVAPQLQRMKSEDLLATVFPDQAACLENIVGERELPDHPLVDQTLDDCLHEAMDCDGWLALLRRMEAGDIQLIARDLPAPSPMAAEILHARPYAFLDDAPLEERRTQAVMRRQWTDPESADDLGALDSEAIAAVRAEAWPRVRDVDEMQEALMRLGCITENEASRGSGHAQQDGDAEIDWLALLQKLARSGHAFHVVVARDQGQAETVWFARERAALIHTVYPDLRWSKAALAVVHATPATRVPADADAALIELIQARLSGFGPVTVGHLARPLALPASVVAAALIALEGRGTVVRGHFSPHPSDAAAVDLPVSEREEWCERSLLARIHRYTVQRLRREIEPVAPRDFMRFLFEWQRVAESTRGRGPAALEDVVTQLEGYAASASAWEEQILPARCADYERGWLDTLSRSGRVTWARLASTASRANAGGPAGLVRASAIVLVPRQDLGVWRRAAARDSNVIADIGDPAGPAPSLLSSLSSRAQAVYTHIDTRGPSFFDTLSDALRLLPTELETALGELVAHGLVHADSFAGLRALLAPVARRNPWGGQGAGPRGRRQHVRVSGGMDDAGRWARMPTSGADEVAHVSDDEIREHVAWTLLRRYGVICWRLLEREADGVPPWRDLLMVYRRLEARGEIRGGRFVEGLSGEQFALPEALPLLRDIRRRPNGEIWTVISAADPLNLVGIVIAGNRIASTLANRIAYCDGIPMGWLEAGTFHFASAALPEARERARSLLVQTRPS
ncbi:DEAD/DEAH box helicase [Robbsia sp. KACC 23696]|uniref:Lhr family helicase n=1 Tax=Robbsia sp. KACC 23696 TaxID=3149231 RepID=UPI00325BA107